MPFISNKTAKKVLREARNRAISREAQSQQFVPGPGGNLSDETIMQMLVSRINSEKTKPWVRVGGIEDLGNDDDYVCRYWAEYRSDFFDNTFRRGYKSGESIANSAYPFFTEFEIIPDLGTNRRPRISRFLNVRIGLLSETDCSQGGRYTLGVEFYPDTGEIRTASGDYF